MRLGLENYTFLTHDVRIKRLSVDAGPKAQNLIPFSNRSETHYSHGHRRSLL
jgi:hypothetical protein